MRKSVAICAASTALLAHFARAAEPKPFLPSGPSEPVPKVETTPQQPQTQEPESTPRRGGDSLGATWSPTATWRPNGPSTYDEDLALAELLNMSATVATKNSAAVSRSPSTVTVYGEQDIRRLGYYTLADLADVTAGYSSYSIFGEKVFETRGQKAGSFVNNKHLILIDGIPVNHGRGNKAMIDENFPLFFANRVEFLKGPASALYGTGAFFGVVNIVPKELEDRGFHAEGRAGYGSNQSEKRVLANSMYRDGVRHAAIYTGFYDKGPSQEFTGTYDNPNNRLWDNQRSEFLYLTYGVDAGPVAGMKAGFIYSSKNGGLGEFWLGGYSPFYNDLTWVQIIPYLKFERRLGKSFTFDSYVKASRDIEQATTAIGGPTSYGTGEAAGVYRLGVMSYEALTEFRWEPSDTLNIIGGLDMNVSFQFDGQGSYGGTLLRDPGSAFKPAPGVLTSDDIFLTTSPFLQLNQTLPVLTALHVTAGARVDTGVALHQTFTQVSPRVGLVQEITDFLSMKALYGQALRAPATKEFGLNREALVDLPVVAGAGQKSQDDVAHTVLKPETIQSLEGAVSLNTTHVSANVVVFVNYTRNALNEYVVKGTNDKLVNIFSNSDSKFVSRGTELEVALAATPDARFFANFAYAKAYVDPYGAALPPEKLANEQDLLANVPTYKVNAGASYRLNKPLDVTGSIVGKWVSGYTGADPIMPQHYTVGPPTPLPGSFPASLPSADAAMRVGAHLLVDANFIWRASEHTSLELMVRNALNEIYKLPQGGVPFVPMPRRSVHVTFDYRW